MAKQDIEDLTRRITQLKNKKDKAKSQKDQLDGQIKGEYARLEKNFGVKTLADAKKQLTALSDRRDTEVEKLESAVEALEEQMEGAYE
jgi:hypothetical protein